MLDLTLTQAVLVALIFVWSGFVRSGLGFGGAVLSLPFLLLIDNRPLVYLPLIAVHLLFFSSALGVQNWQRRRRQSEENREASSVDWRYLRKAMGIIIVPKLIGVLGLLTLPNTLMTTIIFSIVLAYAFSYIFNKPFKSRNPKLDTLFLILGGYISGTSLIGAPLIIAVFATHVAARQLRDTLFVLWFILVVIKMSAFIYSGVDLHLEAHAWLLPSAALGHVIGLRFHDYLLRADPVVFYRVVGSVLAVISMIGMARLWL
ncbi:MAG: sulfite exporter TauE/SafE family protein [Spongiibacteraceae bacterium]|nr:sulfite exporter TauE/SafE family protein [Spongiibacteraceae bacterium]